MDTDTLMNVDANSEVSSYLGIIQTLSGRTPKEKYLKLNLIINDIVTTCHESGRQLESVTASREIPAPILPLVYVLAARKLKLREVILEALKSSNLQVVNQALRAKWFFDGASEQVTVPYFVDRVFSFVSLRTRSRIVKALARGMRTPGLEPKAEQFFEAVLNNYSLSQAMPFLPYCGENFISSAIAEHDIKLSMKMLDLVYRKYPALAILYLHHGRHLRDPEKERKTDRMRLSTYKTSLLRLIKHHTEEYITLSRDANNDCGKIGNARVRYLCKNAACVLVNNPNVYLPTLNYKVVYYNLTQEQFAQMYRNLFPKMMHQFDFYKMLTYLNYYYPKAERLKFIMNQYENVYKKDLFDDAPRDQIQFHNLKRITDLLTMEDFEKLFASRIIFPNYLNDFRIDDVINYLEYYPKEKQLNLLRAAFQNRMKSDILNHPLRLKSDKFLRLLPDNERAQLAKQIVKNCTDNGQSPDCWYCFLPIEESFEIFREKMKNLPVPKRTEWLQKMISACEIYDNKMYLLEVLNYFNSRCKNVQPSILFQFFDYLTQKFEIKDLDAPCFQVFYEIVLRAYVKDELFNIPNKVFEKIFDGMACRLVFQSMLQIVEPEIHSALERLVDMYLEYKIEFKDSTAWIILETAPELELVCIDMFLHRIPSNYPDEHPVWREPMEKLSVVTKLIEKLRKYNMKLIKNADVNGFDEEEVHKRWTRVKSYPWLMKSAIDILLCNEKEQVCTDRMKKCLKEYDEEFYHSIINEPVVVDYVEEIKSGRAGLLLNRDPEKMFATWESYFLACRKLLSINSLAAKKFVLSTKWHNQLPIKFVERSLFELDESGSMTILGLLLDGPDLEKIILPHLPTGPMVEVHGKDARKHYRMATFIPRAINVSAPPVSTDILLSLFQGDYISLAVRSLDNLTWRLEKSKVLAMAEKLMRDPLSGVNRHGPRLVFKVTSSQELSEFVSRISLDRLHQPSVIEAIAKKLLHRFSTQPSTQNWSLVKVCISGLRKDDTGAIRALGNISSLSGNVYTSKYIQNLLARIERLVEKHGMEKELKDIFIAYIMQNISRSAAILLPKEMVIDTIRKYYFNPPSLQVSSAVQSFAKNCISRPFVPPV